LRLSSASINFSRISPPSLRRSSSSAGIYQVSKVCVLQGNVTYPNVVQNTADAWLKIDGVKYKGDLADY
jgi:hypothetical protein